MLKLFISILLSGLILISIDRDALVLLSFKLNQSYIAKNLCEKKGEVKNTCCGNCYLKKQLTKNQEEQNNKTRPEGENNFQPLFYELNKTQHPDFCFSSRKIKTRQINDSLPSCLYLSVIFHPPKIWQQIVVLIYFVLNQWIRHPILRSDLINSWWNEP